MTDTPKHTTGPWEAFAKDEGGRKCYVRAIKPGLPVIAFVCGEARSSTYEAQEANARLIAAAPDLLAACQAIEAHCRVETPETRGNPLAHAAEGKRLREQMRAAIAKATQKEPQS